MNVLHLAARCAVVFGTVAFSSFGSGARGTIVKIESLVQNGTVMLNDEVGKPLVALNADHLFIPASIIKVLTSQISLDLLGAEYRFKTECYFDSSTKSLLLKGRGDPYMISDEIRLLAATLKKVVGTHIGSLTIDDHFFSPDVAIPGLSKTNNPYDALNGALVVNFNTINIGRGSDEAVYSAEKETPLTPLSNEKGRALSIGSSERINLSSQAADCKRYAGELIMTIFREQGFLFSDTTFSYGTVDSASQLVLTYENSRDLSEVLSGLLKYSNNFIANQLFLTIGAEQKGPPASMQKGKTVFEDYLRNTLHIPESELVMVEGSGISRGNLVTGNVMISIMEKFRAHADLLTPKNGHPVKSGTLYGVSNYAGYIKTAKGLRTFVIMLNQEKNNRDAIMQLLAEMP